MDAQKQLQTLVLRCQRGERAAFEELFRQFQPRLRYYLRRLSSNGELSIDDALQEVWIKVVGRIDSLKDRRAFIAWLYAIARNELYSRARMRDPFASLNDAQVELLADDHEPAFSDSQAAQIHAALAKLKPAHREILTLCFLEELSHRQIAGILGIRAGTVKSRIYYAKQSLRKVLERSNG